MKTCLNCKHWDFEGCSLKEDYTTQYDTCDQHEQEEEYTWGVFYSNPNASNIVYDLYLTEDEAIDYAERIATNFWISDVYVRNINTEEDVN